MTPQSQLEKCLSLRQNTGSTTYQDGLLLGLIAVERIRQETPQADFLQALIVHAHDLQQRSGKCGNKQERHLTGQLRAFYNEIDQINSTTNQTEDSCN